MVDNKVVKYLYDLRYDKGACSHFDWLWYSIMKTITAESINFILKNSQELSIHKSLDSIIDKLQEWVYDRREEVVNCHVQLIK